MQRVLISGAGIAGPTLAYWLLQWGFEPTIIERSPSFRTGGYIVDFWGAGFEVADRMNLLPELRRQGYDVTAVRLVGADGARVGGFSADIFRRYLSQRYVSIRRGDLATEIYEQVASDVEILFGDSIKAIREESADVTVSFKQNADRKFDLLVGADGLHSEVRKLVFGSQDHFETNLGYNVAAFSATGYSPRDENTYVAYSSPGKQIARFALRDDTTIFFVIYKSNQSVADLDPQSSLQAVLQDEAWECRNILEAMRDADDLYFDSVSQIRMPSWSKGRVALIGDAAFCVSLLAGEGSSLAMTSSYVLAGELKHAAGNFEQAFRRYEERLRPLISEKQKSAKKFARWFAPDSPVDLFLRNQFTKLFDIPMLARWFVQNSFADNVVLPHY
ncbi:MAG: FAD-binding domain [Candidatus Obscuribacterales bacterium]